MTKTTDVLRRADRLAAAALVFLLAAGVGAAANGDNPSTEQSAPVQLRQSVADIEPAPAVAPQLAATVRVIDVVPSADEAEMVRVAAEQRCLAEAMYYEARGEGVEGEEAIAEVIFHRMHRRGYPASICGVVFQGVGDAPSCQFSFACNGEMNHPKSAADWARAKRLAAKIMGGYVPLGNATGGATSFHAVDVEPDWSGSLERTVQIGNHVFYRPLARTRAS
jgi:spore germination cell wall hydrolase CwlJ-like protein